MEEFVEELMEELSCETVFTIPIFGGIKVYESIVVTWIIMAIMVLFSILVTRHLKVEEPGKGQLLLESCVEGIYNFFYNILGEHGKRYVPYLVTVAVYIGLSNIIGVFGFKPPTKDINVTLGLALMSIVLIEASGIVKKGVKGWLRSYREPTAVVLPINIMEVFIRPLSLCMRLFGNILGAFVIMELIKLIIPVGLPAIFSIYFDLFDGLIQAYVFVFLTTLFISEKMEEE